MSTNSLATLLDYLTPQGLVSVLEDLADYIPSSEVESLLEATAGQLLALVGLEEAQSLVNSQGIPLDMSAWSES